MYKQPYYDYGKFAGFSRKEMDEYLEKKSIKFLNILDVLRNYKVENNNLNYWSNNKSNQFTKEDVLDYFYSNKQENHISYSSIPKKIEDKEYHIARIVYFMRHQEEITDISVFYVFDGYDSIDGLHRTLAGYCLDKNKIKCIVLNYK